MKRIVAVLISIALGTSAFAQKNELTNAYLGLVHYQKEKDVEELARAKVAIDKAALNASTMQDAKTWSYKGQIYLALYQKEFSTTLALHKDIANIEKRNSIAYSETADLFLIEATNSFLKSKQMDAYKVYLDNNNRGLGDCYSFVQNVGVSRYNQKQFATALPMFELASAVFAGDGKLDTLNISNSASCAYSAKSYVSAIGNYKKLADIGYGKANTWLMLARVFSESGDSVNYFSTIEAGLKKYPTDADLLTEDVNIKMKSGKALQAIEQLTTLVEQRPNDAQLNAVVGNVYDRMANPIGADGKPGPKPANYEALLEKAILYYTKAIELNPQNFEAHYNIGALYYNQSVSYYEMSQSTLSTAAKYKTLWEKPLPNAAKFLEAASLLMPKDLNTLNALKACYSQMGDNDNYLRVKNEIKKLQAGG